MTSDNKCALCLIFKEVDNLVDQNEFAYAAVPNDPLFEGHVMVLPKRHTILDDLTPEELGGIHKLTTKLKNKIKKLYPESPPMILSASDTKHASIPGHFHSHIIPFKGVFRQMVSSYYSIPLRSPASEADFNRLTNMLRD